VDVYTAPMEYPKINEKDWPKTIEAIHEFLHHHLGETKIPLAYVVREEVPLPGDPDPAGDYAMIQDEMI